VLLQRLYVLANRGMGDIQLDSGMRKTEVPGGGFEARSELSGR
jgi:hypothetical protein